jgi:hypothetical protein
MTVPFGKYKGRSIEEMASDKAYLDWCKLQPNLMEQYKEVFESLGNVQQQQNFNDKSEFTPEHNKLQARFFSDPNLVSALQTKLGMDDIIKMQIEVPVQERSGYIKRTVGYADLVIEWKKSNPSGGFSQIETFIELKPSIGDDYPQILRTASSMKAALKSSYTTAPMIVFAEVYAGSVPLDLVKKMFKSSDIELIVASEL